MGKMGKHGTSFQSGFTLVELMISAGLFGFIGLVASTILVNSAQILNTSYQRQDALDNLININLALQKFMGQAVNLQYAGNTDLNATAIAGIGRVRDYDSTTTATPNVNTDVTTVAIFIKEGRPSTDNAGANRYSAFDAAGIFFQKPSVNNGVANSGYGGVLTTSEFRGYDYSADAMIANGNYNVRPNSAGGATEFSAHYFKITEFQTNSIRTFDIDRDGIPNEVNDPITGVEFRVVVRLFSSADPSLFRWCPAAEAAAACDGGARFRDYERLIFVSVRNNLVDANGMNGNVPEYLNGPIYFFNFKTRRQAVF